ncbi:MAG TPA: glycosyltransferase family 39 protein [Acidimicrobiia bacterium]|nr:glycosyltransferase family 39 protein [Acidimicrobiia bacterium]
MTSAPPASVGERTTGRGLDLVAITAVALIVRLPAVFAMRHLHPDDGTYGASAVAMRDGGVPFREVFSSQGPLHLPLVYVGDLLGGRTHNSPRVMPLVAGVAAALLAYLIVRRVGTRTGALLAGGLLAVTGSMLWTSGPITSDAPTVAFALGALLAALHARDKPDTTRAILIGALVAAAMLCKIAMGAIAAIPILLLLRRERRLLAIAAATAVIAGIAVTAPFGFSDVWDQAVRYQLDSEREQSILENLSKIFTTVSTRDLPVIVAGALAIAAAWWTRRQTDATQREEDADALWRAVAIWTLVIVVFLAIQPALWRNHLAHLSPGLALLVGLRPPPARWLVAALALVAPIHVWQSLDILVPPDYGGPTREAYDAIRALPDDAWVISDEVGIVWRAGRRTPDDFVDASIKQLQQGRVTTDTIVEAASRDEVCGVLVWSARHWGSLPDLPAKLADAGYEPTERFFGQDGARVLYERTTCPA